MQSDEITNQPELIRKAELYDDLSIMLQEAGSRSNSREAANVVSGVLENLSRDYPEIKGLAHIWTELADLEPKMRGAD